MECAVKMKITKRQLRRIIKEELIREMMPPGGVPDVVGAVTSSDPKAERLQHLINGWISQPITVELVRGNSYVIRGIDPAFVPEVTEEVEEFGGSVQAEMSNVRDKVGTKDLSINLGGIR
jgi:hypothetical protein